MFTVLSADLLAAQAKGRITTFGKVEVGLCVEGVCENNIVIRTSPVKALWNLDWCVHDETTQYWVVVMTHSGSYYNVLCSK